MSGKIIQIYEHKIELPPYPKSKSEILFINEKKENAFWRRLEFPKIWYDFNPLTRAWQQDTVYDDDDVLISLSYEDSELLKRLLIQENKRRSKGVWMNNGGDLEWLAPGYYYNLQWVQMKDLPEKYGNFRVPQNNVLTVWHYVKHKWANAHGLVIPKCKKSGVTQIVAGDYLNDSTQMKGWEMGVMSKEYDHAVDVAMAYYFHGFDNLPYILQPDVRKRNEHEITFGNIIPRVGTKNVSQKKKDEVLNTHVFASKTKPTGFDGPVMRVGWITEMPKTWEASKVSPDTLHKKVVETVKIQTKKNGALLYESYMPEIDDKGAKEFREICKQSRRSTINAVTGKTQSSLLLLPLTAVEANEDSYDKYGHCDRKKALYLINSENDTKKTESDKKAHRRQYPRDENDMFDANAQGSTFDNDRLAVCKRMLEKELDSGKRPWREVNLRWTNSLWETGLPENRRPLKDFCPVYEEELTEEQLMKGEKGSLKIFHDLPDSYTNQILSRDNRDDDGDLCPLDDTQNNGEIIIGSFDPTDYVLKKDITEGSMFGGYGGFLYNPAMNTKFNKIISNTPIYEYHFRHDDPYDDLEMLVKLIIYYGIRVIIEANKKWVVTFIKQMGLQKFLLLKQADGSITPYKNGDENRLVSTTSDMIDAYVRALKHWWASRTPDMMETYKSPDGLQQAMDFEPTETKKYDLTVSLGYWRLGCDSYSVFRDKEREEHGKVSQDGVEAAMEGLLDF